MIGMVLAAHGPLPGAFLESTSMILGDVPQVACISLMPGDSLEGLVDRLRTAVNEVNTGDGVLLLLDIFGGTPANAAAFLAQQVSDVRTDKLEALAETAFSAGQAGITDIGKAFKKFQQGMTG